jgi:hypothetical protein
MRSGYGIAALKGKKNIAFYPTTGYIYSTYMPHRMFSVGEKLPTPVGLLPFYFIERKMRNEIQRATECFPLAGK